MTVLWLVLIVAAMAAGLFFFLAAAVRRRYTSAAGWARVAPQAALDEMAAEQAARDRVDIRRDVPPRHSGWPLPPGTEDW